MQIRLDLVCLLFFMLDWILLGVDHNSLAEISGEMFCHASQMILFSWSLLEGFCCFLHSALKYSRGIQLHSSQVMFSLFSALKTLV